MDELAVAIGLLYGAEVRPLYLRERLDLHLAVFPNLPEHQHSFAKRQAKPCAIVRADCEYADAIWKQAFRAPHRTSAFDVTCDDAAGCHAALALTEYEVIDWSRVLGPPFMIASSFCMRKGLGRKVSMAASLESHAKRCKGHTDSRGAHASGCPLLAALPETHPVDTTGVFLKRPARVDFNSAMAEALFEVEEAMERPWYGDASIRASASTTAPSAVQAQSSAWILKPSLTNKGAGIELVTSIEEVSRYVRALPEVGQWVLQRYIPRPLQLLKTAPQEVGNKFHLRVYVMAVGALTVYVYHEALVLIAVQSYDEDMSSIGEAGSRGAHITNTCVGVENPNFEEGTHVRALSELPCLLLQSGHVSSPAEGAEKKNKVYSDIRSIIAHSFAAQETSAGGYMPLPRCFELYGVDFIVDESFNTWLLEFNPSPDIKQTGDRLGWVIEGMVEGAVQVAVDRRVKPVQQANAQCCEEHGQPDGACLIDVDVEPAVPCASTGMRVAKEGYVMPSGQAFVDPSTVPAKVDSSGWDMVYTRKWAQAHGGGGHMKVT